MHHRSDRRRAQVMHHLKQADCARAWLRVADGGLRRRHDERRYAALRLHKHGERAAHLDRVAERRTGAVHLQVVHAACRHRCRLQRDTDRALL